MPHLRGIVLYQQDTHSFSCFAIDILSPTRLKIQMELLPFEFFLKHWYYTPYHLTSTVIRIHIRANIITIPTTRTARRRVIPITACKQVPVNFVTFNLLSHNKRGFYYAILWFYKKICIRFAFTGLRIDYLCVSPLAPFVPMVQRTSRRCLSSLAPYCKIFSNHLFIVS